MMMHPVESAVRTIRVRVPNFKPKVGIILGSGLGPLADTIENVKVIDYAEIEGFPACSVEGHTGQLYLGTLKGVPVVCLKGRAHYYEGYSRFDDTHSMEQLMAPVRAMKLLGCEILIATNSSGSLRPEVGPGNLVLINDHINFQFNNPLVGPNSKIFGERFVGMEDAYDAELRKIFLQTADKINIPLTEGVYIGVLGPSFETPAEIRAFRQWGADVVGMSTIGEVIAARHCGLKVAAVSVITNFAAGMSQVKLSHEVTLSGAQEGVPRLIRLILAFLEQLAVKKNVHHS